MPIQVPILKIGDVLADRYELIGKLGQGGSGAVHHAIDLKFEREVAVKVIAAASDFSLKARFHQEAGRLLSATASAHSENPPMVVLLGDRRPGAAAKWTEAGRAIVDAVSHGRL